MSAHGIREFRTIRFISASVEVAFETRQYGAGVVVWSDHPDDEHTRARTVLTSKEARELAARLIRAADFIDSTPAPEVTP